MSELSSKILAGRVAMVTGGSSGIGEAIARLFASQGAKVAVVASSSLVKAQRVASSISEKGASAAAFACDVRDPDKLKALVQDVEAALGPIDILVNSAGVFYLTPLGKTAPDDFTRMVDINLKGVWLSIDAVAPGMISRKRGTIINMASTAGLIGIAGFSAYCATKAAIVMMTKAMARELAPHGINVNAIAPGNTATPMNESLRTAEQKAAYDGMLAITPSGNVFSAPEEIAAAALFLASPAARPMHGSTMVIDEGISTGI